MAPRTRRLILFCGWAPAGLLMALGWYSYNFTGVCVDCVLPAVEIRINVQDESGRPVAGAEFNLRRKEAPPFVQERQQLPLRSDAGGRIVLHSVGGEYGGRTRRLFWLIPIDNFSRPVLDCELTCPGYKAGSFELDFIRQWANSGHGDAVGHTVVMRRS
jgi:hypothetical protein